MSMSMRVWRFANPVDHGFAEAGRRGSWTPASADGACLECGASRQRRAQPLVMEWKPGSAVVGDFTWPGFDDDIVVADRALTALQEHFSGFEAGPVEMVQDPNLKPGKRGNPRVWLPYEGPPLHELWVTTWVHMDQERSSAELERRCGMCGTEFWELYGVERWDSHLDRERMELVRTHSNRLPDAGVVVVESDLAGAAIFRVREFPARVFCTDPVRELVVKESFSNVSFLEMGETL